MQWLRTSGAALLACSAAPFVGALWLAKPALRAGLRERLGLGPEAGLCPRRAASGCMRRVSARVSRRCVSPTNSRGAVMRCRCRRRPPPVGICCGARGPIFPVRLAPLDHPFAVGAALARVSPRALVLVETELWPSWIAGARRRGIPVAIVSGRISDRSFPRYRALATLLRPTLVRLAVVGVRAEEDARRFVALGVDSARVHVTGDLKLDARVVAAEARRRSLSRSAGWRSSSQAAHSR